MNTVDWQGSGDDKRPREQWRTKLGVLAMGYILFESLSGLWILFGPFSVTSQMLVLVHTAAGIVFLAPCAWYLGRHWIRYFAKPWSHIVVVGYLGLVSAAVCLLSGVVLSVQAIAGTRIGYGWDAAHIGSTAALLVFIGFHLTPLIRRDASAAAIAAKRGEVRAYGAGAAAVTLGFAAVALIGALAYRPPALQSELPADYSYAYGEERPFAPSLARTDDGGPLDPRVLSGSESCGTAGCHTQVVEEWRVSAHRWAAMDPGFQKIQSNMAEQNGPESTRYCGGCHDPISLFSGSKNLFVSEDELTSLHGYQEGVACLVCHAIRQVDVKGNADYVVAPPSRYLFEIEYAEQPSEAKRLVRDFLIRAYPRQHVEELSKTLFKAPEYCAACHKQFIDQEINRVGWVQLQNQYDNWKQSHWNQPGDPTKTIECRECHMPLNASDDPAAGDSRDYNRSAGDGRHRSHRFLASNQFVPGLLDIPGADRQIELTEQWLQGRYEIPEIEDKWARGPIVSLEILAPPAVSAGEKAGIKLVISSNKVGHDFPTGPLDIIQAWVELTVKDNLGRTVFVTGRVDEQGFIEPGTFMLKAEPVDQQGNLIDRHNLWEMVGVRHRRALFPGFSDTVDFTFFCPEVARPDARALPIEDVRYDVSTPESDAAWLDVTVRLRYRKISQYLLDFMFGADSGITAPITDLAAESARIPVRKAPSEGDD